MTDKLREAAQQALEDAREAHAVQILRAALAEQQEPVPEGYKLVPVETLDEWRQRVNTLAALSTKADRYKVGVELKQSIRDVMDAAPSTGETHD